MTPTINFAAFKDLQELTQATDEQIEQMLIYGCAAAPDANYEDVITQHLLRLFRHITGVDWVRGWEQGARPDKQFATIWLYALKVQGTSEVEYAKVYDANNVLLPDLCEIVYQHVQYQFQLDVYRDNGVSNRNQEITTQSGPRYSAVDVLTRLITALAHPRFRRALAEKCVHLGTPAFGQVRNFAKPLVQNTFESRAGADFFVTVRTASSLRSPAFGNIDWGFVCPPDAQLFPDPPTIPPIC